MSDDTRKKLVKRYVAEKTGARHVRVTEDSPGFNPLTQGNHRAGRKKGSGAGAYAGSVASRRHR